MEKLLDKALFLSILVGIAASLAEAWKNYEEAAKARAERKTSRM